MLHDISPPDLASLLGPAIKARREACGYTLAEVAQRLGVQFAAIAKWESGRNEIKGSHLVLLCDYLGCTVDEIVQDALKLISDAPAKK